MSVLLEAGAGGLPRLRLADPSGATAEIYLHGAHVSSWTPAGGEEALFLSRAARFAEGAAIRGGVPVIFPQFSGLGPLPKHGFARTQRWEWLADVDAGAPGTSATLRLCDSPETRAIWPHAFVAELQVLLEARRLALTLSVRNAGAAPLAFTAALHTYLRVASVLETAIEGLAGVGYRDAGASGGQPMMREEPGELVLSGPVDRVYLNAPDAVRVHDRAGRRTLVVRSHGTRDLVLWNPWREGAAALSDMLEQEHLELLCLEAAQVQAPVELAPGEAWRGGQSIEVQSSKLTWNLEL